MSGTFDTGILHPFGPRRTPPARRFGAREFPPICRPPSETAPARQGDSRDGVRIRSAPVRSPAPVRLLRAGCADRTSRTRRRRAERLVGTSRPHGPGDSGGVPDRVSITRAVRPRRLSSDVVCAIYHNRIGRRRPATARCGRTARRLPVPLSPNGLGMNVARSLVIGLLGASVALLSMGPLAGCASSDGAESSETKSQQQSRAKSPDYASTPSEQSEPPKSGEQPSTSGPPGDSVSDKQLDQFIRISQKLRKLRKETQTAARQAESKQEKKKIQRRTKKRMKTIFATEDMTRREYRKLAKRIQSDRKLQRRMKKRMQQTGR